MSPKNTRITNEMTGTLPEEPATAARRFASAIGVLVPFLGLLVAIYGFWGWGVTWIEVVLLLVMYTVTGLGVTVGYHRLFAHRSFQAPRPVEFLLASTAEESQILGFAQQCLAQTVEPGLMGKVLATRSVVVHGSSWSS